MSFLSSVSTLEKLVIPSETADLGYSEFNIFLIGCGGTGSFVTQHLARLEDANLVAVVRRGREKLHYLNPVPLFAIYERWIEKYERQNLAALRDLKKRAEGAGHGKA